MLSRRSFLAFTGVATLGSRLGWAADVPKDIDHIILGCNDLARGIDYFERLSGVRAVFGGVHPGRGTRNALLALGPRTYLEIMAPDPKQPQVKWYENIVHMATPRPIDWAVHTDNLDELARRLNSAGISVNVRGGSRARPDGRMLKWTTMTVSDAHLGLLPFVIQWDAGSPHPALDAPKGCTLESFSIATPDPQTIRNGLQEMGVDATVVQADSPGLRVRIKGKKGAFEL